MAVWPASLPQYVNSDSYKESYVDNVLRSSMSIGSKSRLRDTKEIRQFSVSITCSNEQKDTFRAFYRDTLSHGSQPFDWFEFTDHTIPMTYKFTGAPDIKSLGGMNFSISMNLVTI